MKHNIKTSELSHKSSEASSKIFPHPPLDFSKSSLTLKTEFLSPGKQILCWRGLIKSRSPLFCKEETTEIISYWRKSHESKMPEDRRIDQKDNGVFPLTWIDFGLRSSISTVKNCGFCKRFCTGKTERKNIILTFPLDKKNSGDVLTAIPQLLDYNDQLYIYIEQVNDKLSMELMAFFSSLSFVTDCCHNWWHTHFYFHFRNKCCG